MRKTPYYGVQHPAVGAVACPSCGQQAGVPCIRYQGRIVITGDYTDTHVRRVKLYEREMAPHPEQHE